MTLSRRVEPVVSARVTGAGVFVAGTGLMFGVGAGIVSDVAVSVAGSSVSTGCSASAESADASGEAHAASATIAMPTVQERFIVPFLSSSW